MSEQRWTPETVVLVRKAMARGFDWKAMVDDIVDPAVVEILAALADAGLLVTPSTPDGPRSWTLPAEPGPEVTAVRDKDGSRWARYEAGWHGDNGAEDDYYRGRSWRVWIDLVAEFGPLTDATGEAHSGQ